jgi:hypothetical protein
MLTASTVEVGARTLLNELVANFWTPADMTSWIQLAANDISNRTFCVEETEDVSLVTATQTYMPARNFLKVQDVLYTNIFTSLKRAAGKMMGVQTAVPTGPPEYFFEFAGKVWFFPVPTTLENAHIMTLMLAIETNDITKIPSRYHLSAILFVTAMGLLKERNNNRATQIFSWYISTLQSDVQNVILPKGDPPALDTYSLKQTATVYQQPNTAAK